MGKRPRRHHQESRERHRKAMLAEMVRQLVKRRPLPPDVFEGFGDPNGPKREHLRSTEVPRAGRPPADAPTQGEG